MKIQLKNSSVYQNGAAFPPTASQMADGELAVNFNNQDPAIFLKDSTGNIVRIAGAGGAGLTNIQTVIPIQATAPGTPDTGNLYYDTDDNRLYIYNGTSWLDASQEQFNVGLIPDVTNASPQSGTLDDRYALTAGDTFSGNLILSAGLTVNASDIYLNNGKVIFEGTSNNGFETELVVTNPTQDNTITLPDTTGTVITTGDSGTVTSAMIANGTIVDADINGTAAIALSKLDTGTLPSGIKVESANITDGTIVDGDISSSAAIALTKLANGSLPAGITVGSANLSGGGINAGDLGAGALPADVTVSTTNIVNGTIIDADISTSAEINVAKLADGTPGQLIQTDSGGTGVEWTSNIDIPGTLDVTGIATFDNNVSISGDLSVTGSSISLDANIVNIKDKNIQLGVVSSPSNSTGDGGGITLKASTDKTFNWVAATDSWTSNTNLDLLSGLGYYINSSLVLSGTTLGSTVVNSSLTSLGTINTGIWNGTPIDSQYIATITTAGKVANSATSATSLNSPDSIVLRDGAGDFSARFITADLIGHASTSDKWLTARTLTLNGDINGSASIDGSGNVTLTTSYASSPGTINTTGIDDNVQTSTTVGGVRVITGSNNPIWDINIDKVTIDSVDYNTSDWTVTGITATHNSLNPSINPGAPLKQTIKTFSVGGTADAKAVIRAAATGNDSYLEAYYLDGTVLKGDTSQVNIDTLITLANTPSATNLSYTASTRELASSTGNNVILPLATTTDAGLLASSDQIQLNNLSTNLAGKADLSGGKLVTSQLPDIAISEFKGAVANQAAMLAISGEKGDWVTRTDDGKVYVITGNDPTQASSWTALSYPVASGTDLTYTASTRLLSSSTGADVNLPLVVAGGDAGLLTGADKTKLDGLSSGASVSTSTTPPNNPSAGDLWYETEDGRGYVYYDDGSSSQWVEFSPSLNGNVIDGSVTPSKLSTGGPNWNNSGDVITLSNQNIKFNPNGSGVVEFKGNATRGSGTLLLNCENNTHGVKIKGPPHSAAATYTLTLPNNTGTNGQFLATNGSGVTSWSTMNQVIIADGGNFDNGSSLVSTTTSYDGGSFN